MKQIRLTFACLLALALSAASSLRAAEEGQKEGKATVRSVHGTVEYMDNASWVPVRPNMKFGPGVTLRTGADGVADISVNGTSSAVRMTNNTTLQIPAMSYVGSVREGDTTTMLNLVNGAVIGNVKKITANSRYEITTPHGVAGIRGTDFRVESIRTEEGKFTVRFDSITGVITVSAVINGQTVTHTLTTGTSWTIGESPRKMAAELIQNYQSQILGLVQTIENSIGGGNNGGAGHGGGNPGNNPPPDTSGPANGGPGPGGVSPTPQNPFPGQAPPQGPPASS